MKYQESSVELEKAEEPALMSRSSRHRVFAAKPCCTSANGAATRLTRATPTPSIPAFTRRWRMSDKPRETTQDTSVEERRKQDEQRKFNEDKKLFKSDESEVAQVSR